MKRWGGAGGHIIFIGKGNAFFESLQNSFVLSTLITYAYLNVMGIDKSLVKKSVQETSRSLLQRVKPERESDGFRTGEKNVILLLNR